MLKIVARLALMVLISLPVIASHSTAQTQLPPHMEERAKSLFLELRCVVCQNQSIGDSDADVAKDLREIVREQMLAGKSDAEIRDFLVARYGEFILLKPVFAWHTALLWIAPIALLLIGGLLAWRVTNKKVSPSDKTKLSEEDEAELAEILRKSGR